MKSIKLLPLSLAITAALSTNAFANDAQDEIVHNEPTAASDDLGFYFSGYARYGMHYTNDMASTGKNDDGEETYSQFVGAHGQAAGAAVGRLGNEMNGGEFQFGNRLVSDNGTEWDVAVMLEHWGDDVGLKKFYAKATNVFESQPNMTVWAGRDFHQRHQAGLNDYFVMSHDGQGGGFENLELGGMKLNASVIGQTGESTYDSGVYAFTSKLHGIDLGIGDLSLIANYGFASDQVEVDGGDSSATSYQLMAVLDVAHANGWNQGIVRYADGADNSVFTRDEDLTTVFAQLEGSYNLSNQFEIGYLGAYHNTDNADAGADKVDESRTNYSAIVRPMYNWNDVHSTWVEAGYSLVDFENDGENSAYKLTLSQNISFGHAKSGDRPMLRFYATYGEYDNAVTTGEKDDQLAVGAMWEAWW